MLIAENPIESINWIEESLNDQNSGETEKFKHLESLNLTSLLIKDFKDFNDLKYFPSLRKIRFKVNKIN